MWAWLDRLGVIVLDASVSVAILLGIVAVAMIACRQPSRRSRIARMGIAAALTLLPLIVWSPLPRIAPAGWARQSGWWPPVDVFPDDLSIPTWFSLSRSLGSSGSLPVARVLTVLYLAGVLLGLCTLLLGFAGLQWVVFRARSPEKLTTELYESLPLASKRRRPRLLVSDRVRGPVLAGFVAPVILIPAEMERTEAAESLRLGLRHELAHAEAGDAWFALVSGISHAFWFFLPPLWWIRSQLRLDHEYLADYRAALGFEHPGRYAASLMSLAEPARGDERQAVAPARDAEPGAGSPLYLRLLMLIRSPFAIELAPPAWWSATAMGVFAGLSVFLSCLSWAPLPGAMPALARATTRSTPHVFRMGRLFVDPNTSLPNGRSVPHELPVRLPRRFALRLDVWCDRAAMSEIRIAGHPLLPRTELRSDAATEEAWHQVDLRCDSSGTRILIDGVGRTVDEQSETTSAWLTIEPAPDRPGLFRRLVMTW